MMTIRQKIVGKSIVAGLLVIAVSLLSAISMIRVSGVLQALEQTGLPNMYEANELATAAARIDGVLHDYQIAALGKKGDEVAQLRSQIDAAFVEISHATTQMEEGTRLRELAAAGGRDQHRDTGADRALLNNLEKLTQAWRNDWSRLSAKGAQGQEFQADPALAERTRKEVHGVLAAACAFQRDANNDVEAVIGSARRQTVTSARLVIATAAAAVVLSVVLACLVAMPLVARLSRVRETATEVGKGNLNVRLEVGSLDEIGQLAVAFNDMAAALGRSRDEIRESESRFRQLAETIREVFWINDPHTGKIHYVSPAFEEIWGLPRQGVYDNPATIIDAIYPEDQPKVIAAIEKQAVDGLEEEYRISRPDGTMRWIHDRGFAVRDENGKTMRVVGIAEDVTERKTAEEALRQAHEELERRVESRTAELEEVNEALRRGEAELTKAKETAESANRAKSEFLARMSHEFRTPLNGVIGMSDLLLSSTLTGEQANFAQLAKTSADALLALVNDVLDFSKIEAGKLELEQVEFSLQSVIEGPVEMLARKAADKSLKLESVIGSEVPQYLRGDPERLRQVLINLINNAVKFTERGGVLVRVELEERHYSDAVLRVEVRDTGIGIAADRLDRLFKPFFQADSSTTRRYGGTGLGLVLCKELVELMGGHIGVRSQPGEGSTFWFTASFPVVVAPEDAIPHHSVAELEGLRALVVGKDDAQRRGLCDQLGQWKMETATASSDENAMEMLCNAAATRRSFQVVLIESRPLELPLDSLPTRIRRNPTLGKPALVLLATVDELLDPAGLRERGFVTQVTEPVRQSQLFDRLTDALSAVQPRGCGSALPVTPGVPVESTPQPPARKDRGRVLLVEDNVVNQKVASEYLRRAGYQHQVVQNGLEAYEAVLGGGYDVVLMDCQMPVMDGFEATRLIRQAEAEARFTPPASGRLPIIALTANAIKGDRETCFRAGMDDYISKPLNPSVLIETLERALSRKAAPQADGVQPAATRATDGPAEPEMPSLQSAPDAHAGAPVDFEAVMENCFNDPNFVREIARDFSTQADADLGKMSKALETGDTDGFRRAAHSLKGAAAYLRAESVRGQALKLEELGRAGTTDGAAGLLRELRREVDRCVAFLRDRMATGNSNPEAT